MPGARELTLRVERGLYFGVDGQHRQRHQLAQQFVVIRGAARWVPGLDGYHFWLSFWLS